MFTTMSNMGGAAFFWLWMQPHVAYGQTFTFDPPGRLSPSTSGQGRVDSKVYAPSLLFPMEKPNAYANSQVYGYGGGSGPAGSQCATQNYSYPWHDNYCESRSYDMPLCPTGTGHQGQDIRPATCVSNTHWVLAVADGRITSVGSYSVYLTDDEGVRYDYLHMGSVQVAVGSSVKRGDRIGKVSNVFGGTPTTIHLHFNIRQTVANVGSVYVPPYLSLVESYKRLLDPSLPVPKVDAGAPMRDGGRPSPALDAGLGPNEEEPPPSEEEFAPFEPVAQESACGCGQANASSEAWFPALAALLFLGRRRKLSGALL